MRLFYFSSKFRRAFYKFNTTLVYFTPCSLNIEESSIRKVNFSVLQDYQPSKSGSTRVNQAMGISSLINAPCLLRSMGSIIARMLFLLPKVSSDVWQRAHFITCNEQATFWWIDGKLANKWGPDGIDINFYFVQVVISRSLLYYVRNALGWSYG